jgi:cell division protein FtsQ
VKKGATRVQQKQYLGVAIKKWAKPLSISVTVVSVMIAVSVLVLQLANKELNRLEVRGLLKNVTAEDVRIEIQDVFPAGFVSLDVDVVKERIESMPLVATASVEKSWSGVVFIDLVEEVPVAIWNDSKLLSQRGDILPVSISNMDLPKLVSSDQDSRKLMEHFLLFNRWSKRHGLVVKTLTLSTSGWLLDHESGLMVWLDGANAIKGLKQLERVIDKIQIERISRIDMRYEQGFAVAWKHGQAQVQG